MPGCAAIGCNNRSEKGYTMKCFPRNPNLRRIWKERVSRADWEPSNNSFLCHVHFDSDQWVLSQSCRVKLKKNAVPSIFTITSTRKSPRKRRKSHNCESIDYLSESLDPLSTVQNTIRNRFSSYYVPYGMHDASSRKIDGEVVGAMTNSLAKVKPEMKSQLESDQDLDDIERKLRLICDGESVTDENADYANGDGSAGTRARDRSRENGESASEKDVKEIGEAIDKSMRSHYETTRDVESTAVETKPALRFETARRSTFTIKVTGLEEDVEEIVEGLGSEHLEYKSSCGSRNNRRLVTSVISVTDTPVAPALKKPKLEIDDSSPSDSKADWNWRGNGNTRKLSMISPDDDNLSTTKRLREQILFQEDVIRKLTDRLMTRVESTRESNSVNSRNPVRESSGKSKTEKIDDKRGNSLESNENLLKGLSTRVNNLEEINKSLQKRLAEKEQERKKFELQIRQRDNRIKELNWKLDKASKYVERAEKNAITYRKKMINMQSSIARRKIVEGRMELAETERSEKKAECRITQIERDESVGEVLAEDRSAPEDGGLYRTVQDIFDESNDCDDDPCVIDTREDFIRQFEDTFEPRV